MRLIPIDSETVHLVFEVTLEELHQHFEESDLKERRAGRPSLLSNEETELAFVMLLSGSTHQRIADYFGVERSTITKLAGRKVLEVVLKDL